MIVISSWFWGCAQPRPIAVSHRTPTTLAITSTILATAAIPATSEPQRSSSPFGRPATATIPSELPTTTSEAATATPKLIPTPTAAIVIIPAQPTEGDSEERWRAQQLNRTIVQPTKLYEARTTTSLFWYDPSTGQVLEIGSLRGAFPVQAQFIFRPTNAAALEVPYRINGDFGLTAISEALLQRMTNAGYEQSVEAFVIISDSVVPKP